MSIHDKTSPYGTQANKQAGGPQVAPQGTVAPDNADAAGGRQQAGSAHQAQHQPQRFSQKVAQKMPSDPDPDDPVSP